jgi:hypothetical protein
MPADIRLADDVLGKMPAFLCRGQGHSLELQQNLAVVAAARWP